MRCCPICMSNAAYHRRTGAATPTCPILRKYQDRILFGKDAYNPRNTILIFAFSRPEEYFPYYKRYHAFWRMYGIGLPDEILKVLYYKNALKVIPGWTLPISGINDRWNEGLNIRKKRMRKPSENLRKSDFPRAVSARWMCLQFLSGEKHHVKALIEVDVTGAKTDPSAPGWAIYPYSPDGKNDQPDGGSL